LPSDKDFEFLTYEILILIHSVVTHMAEAESERICNKHKLESAAAAAPQFFCYNPDSDMFDLAACYAFHISMNHPFVDGNKRTSFMAVVYFLHTSGITDSWERGFILDGVEKFIEEMVMRKPGRTKEDLAVLLRDQKGKFKYIEPHIPRK
jgi:death-on-curing family protein